jgi:hypothetical protein
MVNRLSQYFENAANAETQRTRRGAVRMANIAENSNGTKAKAEKTAFGKRLAELMTVAGYGTPKQIETGLRGNRKESPFSYKKIYDLFYEADPKSIEDIGERAPLIRAVADLAGIPVSAFFSDVPADQLIGSTIDAELVDKAAEALSGPKREFLADAIEMAHQALAATKSHYRRHP